MTRFLIRVVILFFLLILGAHGYTHRHSGSGCVTGHRVVLTKDAHTQKQGDRIRAITEEDEEETSRKQVIHNYLLSAYFIQAPHYLHNCFSDRLPFCEHLSGSSAKRIIVQRVIRI